METYKRKKDKLSSKIQDETVMVDIDQGQYFSLNGVGTDIWDLLEEEQSIDSIIKELLNKYDIDEETCREETVNFLNEMLKLKLIDVSNE